MRAIRFLGTFLLLGLPLACGGGGGGETAAGPPFDVSGEIQIAFASAVDSDLNDPAAPSAPNNTPATAQPVPNPVTLGGYVNVAGEGAPGLTSVQGDPLDYFRVSLAGGQTVRLFMAGDGVQDDLDLALLDEDGDELVSSDTNTPTESVVAAEAGEYVIEVSAFAGASNYVLSIGQSTSNAIAAASEFVPGHVIVRMRDAAPSVRARGASASAWAEATATRLGLELMMATPDGPQLLGARDAHALYAALRAAGVGHLEREWATRSDLRRETRWLAKALRRRSDVLSADLNFIRRPSATPTDEFYPLQWHYPMVRLPEAWDLVEPASGVVVAVIDTGIVAAHPEFSGQLVAGYDMIQSEARARDNSGCDNNPNDPGDSPTPGASSFHGTHVAGTIVAATSLAPGGNSVGVAGVAWNAKVMPVRALGVDGGTDADLILALRYAASLPNSGNVNAACNVTAATPADVINLSLGGAEASAALDSTIAAVRAAGVVVVAAAGNSASSQPQYPAASPGVISVVAVDANEQLAFYSNFGATVDLAAPGGDISQDRTLDGFGDGVLSTLFDDESGDYLYAFYQGTSMATPHVAGVIALMLGVNPDLGPGDIDNLLASGAMTRDIGSSFLFGHGLLDAFAAVSAAIEAEGNAPPTLPPRLAADPGALNFGAQSSQATITLSNAGGNVTPLSVTSVTTDEDDGGNWLSVTPNSVDGAGLGTYRVNVNRSGLGEGIYTGVVSFNDGDLDVPVIMQVGTAVAADANAGHHYILLVDPLSFDTVAEAQAEANDGHYSFDFGDVAPGDYFVFAGTDTDNDGLICDRGEACGAYPTLDQPRALTVEADAEGVSFLTGFGLRLGTESAGDRDAGGIPRKKARSLAAVP